MSGNSDEAGSKEREKAPHHAIGEALMCPAALPACLPQPHRLDLALGSEHAAPAARVIAAMAGAGEPTAISRPVQSVGMRSEFGNRRG